MKKVLSIKYVTFEAVMAVTLKVTIFSDADVSQE
jgi:hypothetical protein